MLLAKPPHYYSLDIHNKILSELFKKVQEYSYTPLYRRIQEIARTLGIQMGVNKSKAFAKFYYKNICLITKNKTGFYVKK